MTSLVAADVDAMTYEELLETFGPGVEGVAGAPAAAIDAVPTSTLAADSVSYTHLTLPTKA